MAGFKTLKDVGINFDIEVRSLSNDLFCAKIDQSYEDIVAKKLRDISLFSSKYRLLHGKETAATQQTVERVQNGANIIDDYGETVQQKILEMSIVKSLTQSRAVQDLISTPNRKLDTDMLERKEKIISALNKFRDRDQELRQLDMLLIDREEEYDQLQEEFDRQIGELKDMRAAVMPSAGPEESGPLYSKLQTLVKKMEMVRWLLGCLVTARSPKYDWLAEPHRRLSVFKITRDVNTVAAFLEQDDS